MRSLRPLVLMALLAGCGSVTSLRYEDDASDTDASEPSDPPRVPGGFVLEVDPTVQPAPDRPILPHRFGPFEEGSGFELLVAPAVRLTGTVQGELVTGFGAADLPARLVPATGVMRLAQQSVDETWVTGPDAAGSFDVQVNRDAYVLEFVPDDPLLPVHRESRLLLADAVVDLDLGRGVPLYGRVRDAEGSPVVGAPVHAVSAEGLATSVAPTDDGGWYEIHVRPGAWAVVSSGPPASREPTLISELHEVDDEGLRVDLSFRATTKAVATLRLVGPKGGGLSGMAVRLVASSLADHGAGATFQLEGVTDNRGFLDARLPAGTYAVETLPRDGDPYAPIRIDALEVLADVDLGSFEVPGVVEARFELTDPDALPLLGAPVVCVEPLGNHRLFTGATDGEGVLAWELPEGPLDCVIQPPSLRDELAPRRIRVERPGNDIDLALDEGVLLVGRVTADLGEPRAEPLTAAILRVVDSDGVPVGFGLTDDTGRFALRVPRVADTP